MFNRDSEQHVGAFTEKSKEFIGNAVTSIDVHQTKPEFVVLGFQRGQLVLVDVSATPGGKSLKIVKDHHTQPVVCARFCDWHGPPPPTQGAAKLLHGLRKPGAS